jgi:fatty acid desaturase
LHHLAPRIPNYNLRAAFESSPLLRRAPRLTLLGSLRCARMKLWNEDEGLMAGFPKPAREAASPRTGGLSASSWLRSKVVDCGWLWLMLLRLVHRGWASLR